MPRAARPVGCLRPPVLTTIRARQCLGVPLFVAGAQVPAELVVAAVRSLLLAELQFLITDRCIHFTAQVFAQLARQEQFIHGLIARHRPESHGSAERVVRTLKEWLADKTWVSEQELARVLEHVQADDNDRPHQGIAIPGLSPNEFAERIWLFSCRVFLPNTSAPVFAHLGRHICRCT